jgi:peptidyl-prolyl cis-trans isomerase SurA
VGVVAILAIAGAAAVIPLRTWWEESRVVARVNGDPIGQGEMERLLSDAQMLRQFEQELGGKKPSAQDLQRMVLRELILRHLFLQEAARRQFLVTEQDLDRAIAERQARLGGKAAFEQSLTARGLTERTLRDAVRTELLVARVREVLAESVRIGEQEVQEFYEAHKAQFAPPEEQKLRIIAAKDLATAQQVSAALGRGEDFTGLARTYSIGFDPERGGDLGWVDPRFLPPPLGETVARMKAGETSLPLQGRQAVYIVRVEGKRAGQARLLADLRPEIERRLLAMKQQKTVEAWLADQERTAKIETAH